MSAAALDHRRDEPATRPTSPRRAVACHRPQPVQRQFADRLAHLSRLVVLMMFVDVTAPEATREPMAGRNRTERRGNVPARCLSRRRLPP